MTDGQIIIKKKVMYSLLPESVPISVCARAEVRY